MKLTKKKALEITIELWQWIVTTDTHYKDQWPGWLKNGGEFRYMDNYCPCCKYGIQRSIRNKKGSKCDYCPLAKGLDKCGLHKRDNLYDLWRLTKTVNSANKILVLAKEELIKLNK